MACLLGIIAWPLKVLDHKQKNCDSGETFQDMMHASQKAQIRSTESARWVSRVDDAFGALEKKSSKTRSGKGLRSQPAI